MSLKVRQRDCPQSWQCHSFLSSLQQLLITLVQRWLLHLSRIILHKYYQNNIQRPVTHLSVSRLVKNWQVLAMINIVWRIISLGPYWRCVTWNKSMAVRCLVLLSCTKAIIQVSFSGVCRKGCCKAVRVSRAGSSIGTWCASSRRRAGRKPAHFFPLFLLRQWNAQTGPLSVKQGLTE